MIAAISFQEIWEQVKGAAIGTFEYVSNPWVLAGIVGVVVLIVLLAYLTKRQPSKIRAFNNSNGYVEISKAALVDIIRSTSEQVDIEKKPGVSIKTKRGKLHVDVRIRLLPSRRLTEVSDILQKHLIETLEQGLGIRKLGNINVIVVGVRVKTGKNSRKSLPLYASPELETGTESNKADKVEIVEEEQDFQGDDPIETPVEVDSSQVLEENEDDRSKREQ